jgi:polyadenylate-binding protein
MNWPFQATVYVGNLSNEISESDLAKLFCTVGTLSMVKVVRDKSKSSMGYAYVNFNSPEDVQRARRKFNGYLLNGKHIRVMPYNRDLTRLERGANVYVKNIGSTNVRDLEGLFSTCGNILSSKVAYDKNENPLGYGYLLFENEAGA